MNDPYARLVPYDVLAYSPRCADFDAEQAETVYGTNVEAAAKHWCSEFGGRFLMDTGSMSATLRIRKRGETEEHRFVAHAEMVPAWKVEEVKR